MKIPQVQPWLGKKESEALRRVIKANWITEGPKTAELSFRLNELMGVKFGVFAPNGTLALVLGLLAVGIKPGDEVIVPDCTFIASANAVVMVGATPVFGEVNRQNYQIDVSECDALLTSRTRAIMPVHLYGMVANMTEVMRFARRHKLKVIEDAAQVVGVRYKGKHSGTFGDVGCFSFFADKTITMGEGGYVVCKNKKIYENLLMLRNQGRFDRGSFIHPRIGYNFRITDLQAAIGLVQLAKLDKIAKRKRQILEWYKKELESADEVRFLELESGSEYIPFRVVIICHNAHELMAYLSQSGVQSRTFFYPLHNQPCFAYLGKALGGEWDLRDKNYANSIHGYKHGICLPVFPELSKAQVHYICSHIKKFYAS